MISNVFVFLVLMVCLCVCVVLFFCFLLLLSPQSTRLSLLGRMLVLRESPIQDPIEFNRLRLNSSGAHAIGTFSGVHGIGTFSSLFSGFSRQYSKNARFVMKYSIFAVLSPKNYSYFN